MISSDWRRLEDWEIDDFRLPSRGRPIALLGPEDTVLVVGYLLARGPNDNWLIEPLSGYPQWIQGAPATDGFIPSQFYDSFMPFQSRDERIAAALDILSLVEAPTDLGYFDRVQQCKICKGFRIKRIWAETAAERTPDPDEGIYYLDLGLGAGLTDFLRPDRGLCVDHR